jgi:hypothetical protein
MREFYLSVKKDLVTRAKKASFGAHLARAEVFLRESVDNKNGKCFTYKVL